MEVSGTSSITLGFSLSALEELADPKGVIENARHWSHNIGVLTDQPLLDITDFSYDYNVKFDFNSGARDLETALEKAKLMMVTDRHIYIGTTDRHEACADQKDWEYLSIEEAAAAAEWELTTAADDITYDGDVLELGEQVEKDTHVKVGMNTHRWHQVNRGEKDWLVRPVNDEYNEDTLSEGKVTLLHRGVGESHQLWAVIQEKRIDDSIPALLEDVSIDSIRPHSNYDNMADRIQDTVGDADKYISFRVETVDPEDTDAIADSVTA